MKNILISSGCALASLLTLGYYVNFLHRRQRRFERRCKACQSVNFKRVHTMRQAIGRIYWTSTTNICLDCSCVRVDKPEQPKTITRTGLIWKRLFYRQQFKKDTKGEIKEHLEYIDGDLARRVAKRVAIGEYFGDKSHNADEPALRKPRLL